ncbi:uncharacterized protein G2W53_025414 [Senna tora]|uniref:Uncharacterized protein n=1 Tax=Senna tora TaxID=362788 RepID=A0A834TM78_9FABA|nr:uncharacterized protein G2W53_025414 [Senna tora]
MKHESLSLEVASERLEDGRGKQCGNEEEIEIGTQRRVREMMAVQV